MVQDPVPSPLTKSPPWIMKSLIFSDVIGLASFHPNAYWVPLINILPDGTCYFCIPAVVPVHSYFLPYRTGGSSLLFGA